MMPVPVARKALIRIGEAFSAQKLRHPGIAAQQLVAARKTMVRQKITAIGFDRAVYESLKGEPGAGHAGSVMIHMQVEDDADVVSLVPSEKCILVLVDQADGAVDEVDRMSKKILANRRHELGELRAWHVDLRLRTVHLRAQMRVERAVIVVEIDVDLVRVVSVELACRAEVEVREILKRKLSLLQREFLDMVELDSTSTERRHSTALLLAFRPWVFSLVAVRKRKGGAGVARQLAHT